MNLYNGLATPVHPLSWNNAACYAPDQRALEFMVGVLAMPRSGTAMRAAGQQVVDLLSSRARA